MTLAERAEWYASWARTNSRDSVSIETPLLEELARAASHLEGLVPYAAHRRGCISTLPCSCGLDGRLREIGARS